MKVKSIRLENFTVFKDASFKFVPHFNLLLGKNGSGKSSLWEAIFYLLFDKSPKTFGFNLSPDNLISHGSSFFSLRGEFSLDQSNSFEIVRKRIRSREKSHSERALYFNRERVRVRTSAELLRKLAHIIGLADDVNFSYQALAPILYLRSEDLDQGRPISIELLDYHFSEYIDSLYTENLEIIKELDSEVTQIKSQIIVLQSKIKDLEELQKKSEEKQMSDLKEKLDNLLTQLEEKQNLIASLEIQLSSLESKRKSLEDEYSKIKADFNQKKEESILVKKEIDSKTSLLSSDDKICYVCGQSIYGVEEKLNSEIEELNETLRLLISDLEKLKEKGESISEEIRNLDKEITDINTKIEVTKSEIRAIEREISRLQQQSQSLEENSDFKEFVDNSYKEIQKLVKKASIKEENLLARHVIKELIKPRSIVRFEVYQLILKRLAHLADKFLAVLFENRGYKGLNISLPEGSIRSSGEITSELIFSDGVFKDHDLSSGEKRRLMIATRLALFLLLKEMSEKGKFFNFVVMDEILDHLDETALRQTIQILKNLSLKTDLQIFLSTHNFAVVDLLENEESVKVIEL